LLLLLPQKEPPPLLLLLLPPRRPHPRRRELARGIFQTHNSQPQTGAHICTRVRDGAAVKHAPAQR
jgi:hypothetical protein